VVFRSPETRPGAFIRPCPQVRAGLYKALLCLVVSLPLIDKQRIRRRYGQVDEVEAGQLDAGLALSGLGSLISAEAARSATRPLP